MKGPSRTRGNSRADTTPAHSKPHPKAKPYTKNPVLLRTPVSQVNVKNVKNPLLNHIRGKNETNLTTSQFLPGLLNQLSILDCNINKNHEDV